MFRQSRGGRISGKAKISDMSLRVVMALIDIMATRYRDELIRYVMKMDVV